MFTRQMFIRVILIIGTIFLLGNHVRAAELTWVEISPAQRNQAAQLGIQIYWELENGFFGPFDNSQVKSLRSKGFTVKVLDQDIFPGEYFLIYKVDPAKNTHLGTLLWENERMYLVRMHEDQAMHAKSLGYEMVRFPLMPHPLRTIEPAETMVYSAPDTTIQRLVDQVSIDNLTQNIVDLQNFGTRYSYSPWCDSAADYLYQRFDSLGLATEYDEYMLDTDTSYNVVAIYPGLVCPESIVIACAHFDSYSDMPYISAPGADDDASGVAAVLEIANVLSTANFRWTIMYIAFSGEEQWMVGSTHWVDSIAVPQNLKIAAVYNLDMIGYTAYDTSLLYVTPNIPSQPLAVLAESVNVQYDIGLNVSNYLDIDAYGDHTPFWDQGYKGVFVIEDSEWGIWYGSNPHYHTTHDTLGNLRMSLVLRATQLALACLATYANPYIGPAVEEYVVQNSEVGPQILSIRPNPMRQNCFIIYPWEPDAECGLTVYDAAGRLVRILDTREPESSWDGKDKHGKDVRSGVYFVRFFDQERQVMQKVIVLK